MRAALLTAVLSAALATAILRQPASLRRAAAGPRSVAPAVTRCTSDRVCTTTDAAGRTGRSPSVVLVR
jgi:hypothetical protein